MPGDGAAGSSSRAAASSGRAAPCRAPPFPEYTPHVFRRVALAVALALLPRTAAAASEADCAAEARDLAKETHAQRLEAEVARLQSESGSEWARLRLAAVACLEVADAAQRRACAAPLDAFVTRSRGVVGRLPAGVEVATTACGPRPVQLPAMSQRVEVESLEEARELSRALHRPAAANDWASAIESIPPPTPVASTPLPRPAKPLPPPPDPIATQKRLQTARLESITRLKELITMANGNGDILAEMTLRLADLYLEEGRYQRLLEDRGCAEAEGCPTPERATSSEWTSNSVTLYRSILTRFPQFQRADEATFYLGAALIDLGQVVEGNDAMTALVKNYPESRYIPDAYVVIGDYWFATSNPYKAQLAYTRAAAYLNSDKYPYALYKLAWCHEGVGEHTRALELMAKAVEATREAGQPALEAQAAADLAKLSAGG
ncbi:hypothetical protein LBMAG42_30760 [Deltaproteobacteria bacterium]|nr:hypothetical protein LBMAG42_30760 [Deltaproteobacteria bacterium]